MSSRSELDAWWSKFVVKPDPALTLEQRVKAVREACTGLRLGVRITKDMYRP